VLSLNRKVESCEYDENLLLEDFMADRTIVRPVAPAYQINAVVYSRVSAGKGYIEPLRIAEIAYDTLHRQYRYSFTRSTSPSFPMEGLMPITLLDSEIIGLCGAIDLQVAVLTKELANAQEQLTNNCPTSLEQPSQVDLKFVQGQLGVPRPRFGENEVVYLVESAQSVGRLEAYRIDGIRWSTGLLQWLYSFYISKRPGHPTTVGDRDNMLRDHVMEYSESELCMLCEALPMVVSFLQLALTRSQCRQQALCLGSGSDGH